jgi:hypothetical protein
MLDKYTALLDELPKDDQKRDKIMERMNKQLRKMEILDEERDKLSAFRDSCTNQTDTSECTIETE